MLENRIQLICTKDKIKGQRAKSTLCNTVQKAGEWNAVYANTELKIIVERN